MSFQSSGFAIFTLVLWLLCWGLPVSARARKILLLLGSWYFYLMLDERFFAVLLAMSFFYFFIAIAIERWRGSWRERAALVVAVLVPLLAIGYFKYSGFFLEQVESLLRALHLHSDVIMVVAPIGISFYTFQGLSYVIDVRRGKLPACRNLLDFLLYLSFFPSLLSGPINRATDLLPQIARGGEVSGDRFTAGLCLVVRGFIKKIVFADLLAQHVVDPAFADPEKFSSVYLVLAVYAFTLQIYMDLSGYTDIARGVAKVFGFELMQNFRSPYASLSVSRFWQRWHISMSSFFRDYLFFGLGGSKHGNVYLNILITFVAIGIWHGAGWNFVVYGFLHGSAVCIERYLRRFRASGQPIGDGHTGLAGKVLLWLYMFNFVAWSRILFRSDSLEDAGHYVEAMISDRPEQLLTDASVLGFFLALSALALHFWRRGAGTGIAMYFARAPALLSGMAMAAVFYLLLAISSGGSGFIYFAF